MRFSETPNYWRISFFDGTEEFKTVKFLDGLAIICKTDDGLKVQSILLPKNRFSQSAAKISAFYYKDVF